MNLIQELYKLLFELYVKLFCRKRFYRFNRCLYMLGLRGMGILNNRNDFVSGERAFLTFLKRISHKGDITVLDIGANVGDYSLSVKKTFPAAQIYAFEPHPQTFIKLEAISAEYNFKAYNYGLGSRNGKATLYDYAQNQAIGSQHASIYKGVIENLHSKDSQSFGIEVITIDHFVESNDIRYIDLLKIDTEGNELDILKGAINSIANNMIGVIHFEFNEMNVISRTYFRDFFDILKNYTFYRMLSDGLVLIEYNPFMCEIFGFQNIVAINENLSSEDSHRNK